METSISLKDAIGQAMLSRDTDLVHMDDGFWNRLKMELAARPWQHISVARRLRQSFGLLGYPLPEAVSEITAILDGKKTDWYKSDTISTDVSSASWYGGGVSTIIVRRPNRPKKQGEDR